MKNEKKNGPKITTVNDPNLYHDQPLNEILDSLLTLDKKLKVICSQTLL